MADYSKATNFTAKDGLPTGNAGKIVKGTEIDTEFTAISSAIASKSNINSPTFTGTPAAPTAGSGTNTTQIANTAFVKAAVDALGTIGTMAAQNKTAVDITGGTIVGITDITVADGGTGASSITANSVILGNGASALSGNLVAPGTAGNVLKSNGTTWTSATPTVTSGLGLNGEVWNDVTGSRALGITYTNSRGYPIMISMYGSGAGSSSTQIYVNGTLIYQNNAQWNGAGAVPGGCLIIPNGATYSVNLSSALVKWSELY
jgi:hypothetical protein